MAGNLDSFFADKSGALMLQRYTLSELTQNILIFPPVGSDKPDPQSGIKGRLGEHYHLNLRHQSLRIDKSFYLDDYFTGGRAGTLKQIRLALPAAYPASLFHLLFLSDSRLQFLVFLLSSVHFLELGIYGIFSLPLPLACWRSAIHLTLNIIQNSSIIGNIHLDTIGNSCRGNTTNNRAAGIIGLMMILKKRLESHSGLQLRKHHLSFILYQTGESVR